MAYFWDVILKDSTEEMMENQTLEDFCRCGDIKKVGDFVLKCFMKC